MKTRLFTATVICAILILFTGCAADKIESVQEKKESEPGKAETLCVDTAASVPTEKAETAPATVNASETAEKETPTQSVSDKAPSGKQEEPTPAVEKPKKTEDPPQEAPKQANPPEAAKEAVSPPSAQQQSPANVPSSKPAPVEEHKHSYTETVIAPTCEAGGYTKHTCSCGDSYTDSATAALGHAYEQTGHADATTAAAGYTEYTCSRCGASYRDTIPQIIVTGASAADAQRVCDNVNSYISTHYAITQNRGTYMGVTWVTSPSDVQGAINSAIGTVDLYAQYYGAKSFCCGYFDDGGGNYTIVLYWDTI